MTATVFNAAGTLVATPIPGTHAPFGLLRPEVYLVWKLIQLMLISLCRLLQNVEMWPMTFYCNLNENVALIKKLRSIKKNTTAHQN